jgi:hypothetical protein
MLRRMHIAVGVLVVLIVNALPFWGVFGWNLDPAQLVLLFWLENLANTVLISGRILVHRRLTRKRGHFNVHVKTTTTRGGKSTTKVNRNGSALVAFLLPTLVFTLVHGIFLVILVKLLMPADDAGVALFSSQIKVASLTLVGALLLGFVGDLVGIRERPFAWIRQMSELALGRVVGIHLILLFGLFTVVMWQTSKFVLGAILLLKLMADLSGVIPQQKMEDKPPKWLAWTSRFNKPGEESFEDYWKREHRQEKSAHARDEEVLSEEEYARR